MPEVTVRCRPMHDGWTCDVATREGRAATAHRVSVGHDTVARLAPGPAEVELLVRTSFDFLLEREPATSILRSFELTEIARYFPEYEEEVRRRLLPDDGGRQ